MNNAFIINAAGSDWYRCPKCEHSYFVSSTDQDKHLLKKGMRCPNFRECGGFLAQRAWKTNTPPVPKARKVTAIELYQAAAGIGLPEERKCSPKDIRKLMLGSKITSIHLENAPDPKKSILMSMTLDSGKTVYVTASTKGAIVYKVTDAS